MRKPIVAVLLSLSSWMLAPSEVRAQEGDSAVLALMERVNAQLRERGLGLAVEQIEFFTIGNGRPANRIHQQEFRWVANDSRRLADGEDIRQLGVRNYGARGI